MRKIPVALASGMKLELSPGGQNELIRLILEEFCPRFTPGASVLYVGDARKKFAYIDNQALTRLGVAVDEHGKMPDLAIYDDRRNWLILVEAVTSHGPVSPKRHLELKHLFRECSAGLVFVTAFKDKRTLVRYLSQIAWETEVWVAESPSHMIHFNGARFLGPHPV